MRLRQSMVRLILYWLIWECHLCRLTIQAVVLRTFQALRIDVNSEFEVLEAFLDKLPGALAPNGRAAILTFHSGEDRMVKKAFKQWKKQGVFCEISEEVIRPSAQECRQNGRARSTKMRWAIRSTQSCP